MKHILLLRHAKSSHEDSSLSDFDRPLAPRGKRDAPRMGTFIRETGCLPHLVISSPAKRARQTTQLVLKGAGLSKDIIHWNEDFYYGSSHDYLEAIQKCHPGLISGPGEPNTIMLVGHNPKIEDTARRLGGRASVRMITAALACFEQPANGWNQIQEGLASLKWMMIPKLLAKMDR